MYYGRVQSQLLLIVRKLIDRVDSDWKVNKYDFIKKTEEQLRKDEVAGSTSFYTILKCPLEDDISQRIVDACADERMRRISDLVLNDKELEALYPGLGKIVVDYYKVREFS